MGWMAICDVCGYKYKAAKLRKRWDGLMVCDKDFEHRHPQDFLRVRNEDVSVPFTRPEPEETYVADPQCSIRGRSAVAGYAEAGCAVSALNPILE